jgi:very-short-patch-repair endonuclease
MVNGRKSLKEEFPQIAEEWNKELTNTPRGWDINKRGVFAPENITKGSEYEVVWQCKFGHNYKAPIISRTHMGSGCPECHKRKKTSKYEYIIEYYLSKYYGKKDVYHSYKNKEIGRFEIDVYVMSRKIGFEYDGVLYHKNNIDRDKRKNEICKKNGIKLYNFRYRGLPILDNSYNIEWNELEKYKTEVFNSSIVTVLLNEKNSYIEFEAALKRLFNVLNINVSIDIKRDDIEILNVMYNTELEHSLINTNNDLCYEWNYDKNINLRPEMFTSGSKEIVWWKCREGHEWKAAINSRTSDKGCPICSNRILLQGFNDLQTVFPSIARQWDYKKNSKKPNDYLSGAINKVWWICDEGHSYQAKICDRTTKNHPRGCPFCSGKRIVIGDNDFASVHPDLASDWDYKLNQNKPSEYSRCSGKFVWWKCKCESFPHSYYMSIDARVRGYGCPYCSEPPKKILIGYNDLRTRHPELMKEWDFKNNTIKPENVISDGGKKKAWFICQNNHSYYIDINKKISGRGCPYCSNKKVLKGYNDLLTNYPEIEFFWDYDRNTNNEKLNKMNKWNEEVKGSFSPEKIFFGDKKYKAFFKGNKELISIYRYVKTLNRKK